jgi:hypothetical protein
VDLTSSEFDLLWLLARHAGKVLSRNDILNKLRSLDYDGSDRSVDCRIYRLRRKLGDLADSAERIKTIRNVGYLFSPHTGKPSRPVIRLFPQALRVLIATLASRSSCRCSSWTTSGAIPRGFDFRAASAHLPPDRGALAPLPPDRWPRRFASSRGIRHARALERPKTSTAQPALKPSTAELRRRGGIVSLDRDGGGFR